MASGKAKQPAVGQRSTGKADQLLGLRIRTRRQEVGISQTELGDKLGISFQQIQKYEKGINRVSAARLSQIAAALDCEVSLFLDGAGKPIKITPEMEFIASREGHDIIAAMMRVGNPELRRSVIALARTLAEAFPD